ncbi:MAG: hypothetical protein WCD78_02515, partial [Pseudolabrys sp.]
MLTQWMAKYGYVPIVLIGVAGLALEIGTGEWQGGETVVAKTPVVVETPVLAEAPVVAKSPVAADSTVETVASVTATTPVEGRSPTPEGEAEPKAKTQLAALDPYVRLPDESDQPASKGYIMYANSPVYWTPV